MLKHTIQKFLLHAFAAYGALWTLIESIGAFVEKLRPSGLGAYGVLVGSAALYGGWQARPRRYIELRIPNSDSSVAVEFGDILTKCGCVAIQVNEFFDSLIGDHVSPNSIHGKFIKKVLGGQSAAFDALLNNALAGVPYEDVERSSGNTRRYKIGTTADVQVNECRYLLFAFAKTDVTTLKAYATVHEVWDALAGLWEAVRVKANGYPVYVPLLGAGQAGVGLPEKDLLDLLILSFSYYTKKNKIANRVTVVLHPDLRKVIDLTALPKGE